MCLPGCLDHLEILGYLANREALGCLVDPVDLLTRVCPDCPADRADRRDPGFLVCLGCLEVLGRLEDLVCHVNHPNQ